MSAPPRLLGLRLQGFKSFAERTVVEFGGGISAIVGPNGSGKSNLADALRWALGEQGRSLRIRKSEDVIFAGSEQRAAIGMADVTLILDNADGLLPVEYSVLELGRRLYRSGENDYLLNKQRVRLRDLVDLLEGAHLADNAFLFIGQGMVDQALALRPEERRPLFEEVAGVRRHERRRRRAEEQLAEAEANLARVQDIVAELRPQARRLAAQVEQQTSRRSAGDELVTALLLVAHVRWHEASRKAAETRAGLARVRADADGALAAFQAAETDSGAIGAELGARAKVEDEGRVAYEASRSVLSELQLREARLGSTLESAGRDRGRLEEERAAAEADLAAQRRSLATPVPGRDIDAEAALAVAERELAEALAELGTIRASSATRGEQLAAVRRAEAARSAELEMARRRASETAQRAAEERAESERSDQSLAEAEAGLASAHAIVKATLDVEAAAVAEREISRAAAERADGERQAAVERAAAAGARAAELTGRLETLRARLNEDESRPLARAARRRGGRRLDADLLVEVPFRGAVELALGEAVRAYLVDRDAVPSLASERGHLVVEPGPADRAGGRASAPRTGTADVLARAADLGGGPLADSVRRDPTGAVGRLLASVCWVPDVQALIAIQPHLAPGWLAVVRDGSAAAGPLTIALGSADGTLDRRAEAERLGNETRIAGERAEAGRHEADEATSAAASARAALEVARIAEGAAAHARRRAEDDERSIGRSVEASAREVGWHAAQVQRLGAEAKRAADALAILEGAQTERLTAGQGEPAKEETTALAAWEVRAQELRTARDRLAVEAAERDRSRREVESIRARAEAAVTMDEERMRRVERDLEALAEREREGRNDLDGLRTELAAAGDRDERSRAALAELRAADAADRDRLAIAERAATSARDRLRSSEERLRAAEVGDLEARLGLEAVREGLLVELAALGDLGLRALSEAAGDVAERSVPASSTGATSAGASGENGTVADEGDGWGEAAAFESALASVAPHWAADPVPADAPSPGRLAHLRRRYHELGAANPAATEEYAEVRARLDGLDAQERDLRAAIADTRHLIEELGTMVADQFRTTFRALETAFDARFRQLFGGGFARLSLTDPADLSATGIEIVARPPGKKAQALAMLSGGERALTAVALLFAMLEVRPVPFCVLDEVDAALDEANVGRFADALRSLADRTQFIVITHNRGTIEAADALYGVTVGDDSVSRVISLRLDEATAIADRGAGLADADGRREGPAVLDDVLA